MNPVPAPIQQDNTMDKNTLAKMAEMFKQMTKSDLLEIKRMAKQELAARSPATRTIKPHMPHGTLNTR